MSQLSEDVPKAMERRTAISGLMPARPFRMADRGLAAHSQSPRSFRNGEAKGLKVVILVIDGISILPDERERNPPVAAH